MHRRVPPALALVTLLLAGLLSGCSTSSDPTTPPPPTGAAAQPERRPVIIDGDFDASDIAALLVLLRDPALDVRAIAIDGTGLAHCQAGRLATRYLLDQLGHPDIPFGCGREAGGPDARPFPDDWRALADTVYGLDITPQVESGVPLDAVDVIRNAVDDSPSAPVIVTLGPLTNLEDAFLGDPTLPDRIAGIHAMLGTIDAPGNVFVDGFDGGTPLEWNAFADPSAVAAVFATDVPIDLIPLDATDDVPVPPDLTERLATDHTAAGADLMYELLLRNPSRLNGAEGQQLWDELAALALSEPGLVEWQEAVVSVGDGGRLTEDEAGRPVRFAASADQPAVEAALLDALRRGGPRTTPFEVAGTLTAAWDGTTCSLSAEADQPGLYTLTYQGPSGTPTGVFIAGVRDPATWADLEAFVTTVDLETTVTLPDWLVEGAQLTDETGSGELVTGTAQLEPLTYGPVCLEGEWPNVTFTPGAPLTVSG